MKKKGYTELALLMGASLGGAVCEAPREKKFAYPYQHLRYNYGSHLFVPMALAFPGLILYGIALFGIGTFLTGNRQQKIYLYWFWTLVRGNSVFPKGMALSNPLVFYALLKLVTMLMPDSAFRLAFTNGLMSESMILWFGSMLLWTMTSSA